MRYQHKEEFDIPDPTVIGPYILQEHIVALDTVKPYNVETAILEDATRDDHSLNIERLPGSER